MKLKKLTVQEKIDRFKKATALGMSVEEYIAMKFAKSEYEYDELVAALRKEIAEVKTDMVKILNRDRKNPII